MWSSGVGDNASRKPPTGRFASWLDGTPPDDSVSVRASRDPSRRKGRLARLDSADGNGIRSGGDETRRFTRKTLAHRQAIRRVRGRNGVHEGLRVGVEGLPKDAAYGTFFHQSPGVHDANAV